MQSCSGFDKEHFGAEEVLVAPRDKPLLAHDSLVTGECFGCVWFVRPKTEHIKLLQHTLGGPTNWRNNFVADESSPDYPNLVEMVSLGLMSQQQTPVWMNHDWLFCATIKGRAVAWTNKEEISKEKWGDDVNQSHTPCADCTLCCQGDAIILQPEDDIGSYITSREIVALPSGEQVKTVLLHKDNGDCIYLDRKTGCTIHHRKPLRCQQFDCKHLLKYSKSKRKQMIRAGNLKAEILQAARERMKRDNPCQ
jgi:Fe-S-cluster containining protein